MNSNVTLEQQAIALLYFLLEKQDSNKCIGDLSMRDLIEIVNFLRERS